MARFMGTNSDKIYESAAEWRNSCLMNSGSVLWKGQKIWTSENLREFEKQFIERPDEAADKDFATKFKEQLQGSSQGVFQLAAELLYVHFLFTGSIKGKKKREWIRTVAKWGGLEVDESLPEMSVLDNGIGGTGESYNIRRWRELAVIARFAMAIVNRKQEERKPLLSNHEQVRNIFEDLNEMAGTQTPHVILHLLFPERYERIASASHKRAIVNAFESMLDDLKTDNVDDLLYTLRDRLQKMLDIGAEALDFYHDPVVQVWWSPSTAPQDLDSVTGLKYKKQIVFFGPPGTGKTYQANQIAETLIRQELLQIWGPAEYFKNIAKVEGLCKQRIRRVQFHPGYGYEEFIRGLQLGAGGKTEYRDGVLLEIIQNIESERRSYEGIPFVLILDEMNRADLSRVLGECFSLLENRALPIELAGHEERVITFPNDLYVVGTMNLIDQSLEQVDFALRRRFLWFPRGFSRDEFLDICESRWEKLLKDGSIEPKWSFDYLGDELQILANRAAKMNEKISRFRALGEQFEIGHTYFADIVDFMRLNVTMRKQKGQVLFSKKGTWKEPVQQLWTHSLKPLLDQYLTGVEPGDKCSFIGEIQKILELDE